MHVPAPFSGNIIPHHRLITGEYIFQNRRDNMTVMGKPPPRPTKAEVTEAFFALSGWTPGSKKTNGMIYDKSRKRASLPTKSEMEFILKKAKEQQKEKMSDDEIKSLVEEAKDESASNNADNFFLDKWTWTSMQTRTQKL